MKRLTRIAGLLAATLLLVSCAARTSSLSPSAKPDPQSAILYGRFALVPGADAQMRVALWLQNVDRHHTYYIYFDDKQPVQAIPVRPGHYKIVGYAALDWTHQILSREAFGTAKNPSPIASPFEASAGSEIYLGDFTAETTSDGVIYNWGISHYANNIIGTTAELGEEYPNLRGHTVYVRDLQHNEIQLPHVLPADDIMRIHASPH